MLPSLVRVQVLRRISRKLIAFTSPAIDTSNTCRLISSHPQNHVQKTLDNKSSSECCSPFSSSASEIVVSRTFPTFYGEPILFHSSGRGRELRSGLKIIKRGLSLYGPLLNEQSKEEEVDASGADEETESKTEIIKPVVVKKGAPAARHLDRDRSKIIPVETSMRYLKSEAYREAYGENPIWVVYRRNFPGQFAPRKTRKTCIRNDAITTGNPCPICRDVYLVVDYRNVDLLKQFISPYTGNVLGWDKTGVCRRQHERLLIEIDRARDHGTLTFDVPFREYDYKEYEQIYAKY